MTEKEHPYRERNKGIIILLITTVIWSLAFIAQSTAMDQIGPCAFVFYRHFLSGLCLLPFAFLKPCSKEEKRAGIKGGAITGIVLGFASVIQQIGVKETTVGKAAFLTVLYIILIPIFGLVIGKKPEKKIWFCAILALVGVYFIAIKAGTKFTIGIGDTYIILCSVLYAVQIMQVGYYVKKVNISWYMSTQFLAGSLVGLLGFIFFEKFSLMSLKAAFLPIAYAGIM
ncbi:DMT family transporter, partial [Oribacterium sinus]